MNTSNQRAEQIFAAALEQGDPAQRASYLQRACDGDDKLRQEVDSLLAAHQGAGSFLQGPPTVVAQAAPRVPPLAGGDILPAEAGTPNMEVEERCQILASKGGQIVARHIVGRGEYVIGRGRDSDLVVDSSDVSQRHARLLVQGDEVCLEDLGSSRQMPSSKQIGFSEATLQPVAEFWKTSMCARNDTAHPATCDSNRRAATRDAGSSGNRATAKAGIKKMVPCGLARLAPTNYDLGSTGRSASCSVATHNFLNTSAKS